MGAVACALLRGVPRGQLPEPDHEMCMCDLIGDCGHIGLCGTSQDSSPKERYADAFGVFGVVRSLARGVSSVRVSYLFCYSGFFYFFCSEHCPSFRLPFSTLEVRTRNSYSVHCVGKIKQKLSGTVTTYELVTMVVIAQYSCKNKYVRP